MNAPVERLLESAIQHVNAGRRTEALTLCAKAVLEHPPHPAVLQLLAVLCLQNGQVPLARRHIEASLALRPDHAPSLAVAADAARAEGDLAAAARALQGLLALQPDPGQQQPEVWFQLALLQQDRHLLAEAAAALRCVLVLQPARAEAWVNLGIVLQDMAQRDAALAAFGRAISLQPDTFGRIAHALAASPHGELWLDLDALRERLKAAAVQAA